jgi:predicted DNA-binding transcriptional regulator AlpA
MTPPDTYMKPTEVASQLGVSLRTLSRWQALRVGPPRAKVGRTVLYRIAAVEAWLSQNESQPLRSFARGAQ